jgi:hypothetical protein
MTRSMRARCLYLLIEVRRSKLSVVEADMGALLVDRSATQRRPEVRLRKGYFL